MSDSLFRESMMWFGVFMTIAILYAFFCAMKYVDPPTGLLDESALDTGDVVVLSFSSVYGLVVRVLGGSIWTHAGIVVRQPEGLYVGEMFAYRDADSEDECGAPKEYKNFNLHPIKRWKRLCHNGNLVGVIKRKRAPTDAQRKKVDQITDLMCRDVKSNVQIGYTAQTLIALPYKQPIDSDVPKSVYCSEAVARILQYAEMIETRVSPRSFKPCDFPRYCVDDYHPIDIKFIRSRPTNLKAAEREFICIED